MSLSGPVAGIIKSPFVDHLVVDTAGFLSHLQLQTTGVSIYTTHDVISEIRNKAARERLQCLPFELIMRSPADNAIKAVIDFTKKTGDYPSLSKTDVRVLALCYELAKEHSAADLRSEPLTAAESNLQPSTVDATLNLNQLPQGWHLGKKTDKMENNDADKEDSKNIREDSLNSNDSDSDGYEDASSEGESDSDDADGESSEESEDQDEGWITQSNVAQALQHLSVAGDCAVPQENKQLAVACMTSDFAMQNSLLHFGISVVSINGLVVNRIRSHILRCRACYKSTSVMTKHYCADCGHGPLDRIGITVLPDGTKQLHLSRRKANNKKGMKHSLPAPQGGKHPSNCVLLMEDQRAPENRLSRKACAKLNPMDPEYAVRDSPFLMNDVNSRSAALGVRALGRSRGGRNPNAYDTGKKRGGKKR